MKRTLCLPAALLPVLIIAAAGPEPALAGQPDRSELVLADYFRAQTAAIAGHCLTDIHSLADWEARLSRGAAKKH